jgi:hypothetical protein
MLLLLDRWGAVFLIESSDCPTMAESSTSMSGPGDDDDGNASFATAEGKRGSDLTRLNDIQEELGGRAKALPNLGFS